MKKLGLFLWIWLMVGFTTGTATLIGPVGWIADFGRERGWPDNLESTVVVTVIILHVFISAAISYWLTRIATDSPTRHVRMGIPMLASIAALSCMAVWLSPEHMSGDFVLESTEGSAFTFGPYPTRPQMQDLKNQGYSAVVSLLHPAVVPFETKLIADEEKAAQAVGLEYIHIPMLPWVSDNTEALARIDALAKRRSGRYYVHCYLGRDRIRVAMRIVREAESGAVIDVTDPAAPRVLAKSLDEATAFERGKIVRITEGVFLTPYPTDDEFMIYLAGGDGLQVVSLLDPGNADDRPWIDKEEKLLNGNRVPYRLLPLTVYPYDSQQVLDVARQASRMQRPILIHGFLSADSQRAPTVEGFLQAFRADVPPLPPTNFVQTMGNVPVEVIAPNVATGPPPRGQDFGAYLYPRGIREFVFINDATARETTEDLKSCRQAQFACRTLRADDPDLIETLASGGPWYLYGPGLESIKGLITDRLGPAIPERMSGNPESAADPGEQARASFPQNAMPDLKSWIILTPLFLLLAGAAGSLAGWLRMNRNVRTPYTRKIFHLIIFTTAALLHVIGGLSTVIVFGASISGAVLYAVFRGENFPMYEALARPTDAPRRTLFVIVPLLTTALGGLASNLFFGPFAHVGYLVTGWGDAVGEPVGTAWGRHKFAVPSLAGVSAVRSLEGSAAVCIVGILAACVALSLGGLPIGSALAIGAACGIAGAGVEMISHHGLDNLTVQVAASGTAWLLLT